MAEVRIVYDSDGLKEMTVKGHRVSTQMMRGRIMLVFVYNRKGKCKRIIQLGKVYETHRYIP